jgi:hypothetical protein
MSRRLSSLPCALLALLALAPAAHADWFAAEPVDGPSPDLLGPPVSVDVADDGAGAIVYRKLDGGVPHVFTARLVGGAFQPPRRVDAGVEDAASEAVAVAGEGGRLAYFWLAGPRLYGALEGGAPTLIYQSPGAPLAGLDADMGVNGTAYAVFGAGGDVRAARLFQKRFAALPEPLDIDPGRDAGAPRVAVGADGNALAVWLEAAHVYARRLLGTGLSSVPQEGTLPGGAADSLDISIEDDTMFAWVVFRQDLGGASRAVARRFIGSAFEPPVLMDLGGGAGAPAVAINGRGQGVFAVPAGGAALGSYVGITDVFEPLARLDGTGGVAETVAEASDIRDAVLAWRAGGSAAAAFRRERGPFDPPTVLSQPEFGPVVPGSLALAGDRRADTLLAMLQDDPAGRRLVAAGWDRPPSPPYMLPRRVHAAQFLTWGPAGDAWGVTYHVVVDGVEVGTSVVPRLQFAQPLGNGRHTVAITAVDRHGQAAAAAPARIRVDGYIPRVRAGVRRSGWVVSVAVRARDRGTGLASYRIYWGDKSRPARGAHASHVYRPGRYRLVVIVRDRAGNAGRKVVAVRIR